MPNMHFAPSIRSVGTAVPPHYVDQATISSYLRKIWAQKHHNEERVDDFCRAVRVSGRHFALPPEELLATSSFGARNDAWTRVALDVGAQAIGRALDGAGLRPADVDHIFFTTVTGIAAPSIDARLVHRLGMRPTVKRTPLFGLGCVAGAAGTARASDYLRAFPDHVALLLSVELCSLTLQRDDASVANMIASGLFGDGAAAVVLAGAERAHSFPVASGASTPEPTQGGKPFRGGAGVTRSASPLRPKVVATRSVLYPDSERIMGWDVTDNGFRIVLSARVPSIVRQYLKRDVDEFLGDHDLGRSDVAHWLVHTGGPKVLDAIQESLELPQDALARSWKSLDEVGNLSSASVLFVLGDFLNTARPAPGDYGLLAAMGPGFCSELVLLQW